MATTSRDGAYPLPPVIEPRTRAGRMWQDAPLRRKLLTLVATIALVSLPPIGVGLVLNVRLIDARAAAASSAQSTAHLDAVLRSLLTAGAAAQSYAVPGFTDASQVDEYRRNTAALPGQLDTLRDGMPADLASRLPDLEDAVDDLIADYDAVTAYGAAGTRPANVATDPTVFEVNPDLVDILLSVLDTRSTAYEAVEELERRLGAQLSQERREIERLQEQLVWATFITVVAAIVAAGAVTYLVTNGVVRRIEALTENATRFIARRPLRPALASRDEVGQLTDKMLSAGELLNRRREQAVAATNAKDEFLSRVSHELKTPLTAMIGFAQLLEEDPDLDSDGRRDAEQIVAAGHHLHQLIEELLDIKAIEAGKLALTFEPVAVHEAVDEVVNEVRASATTQGVTLVLQCPPDAVVAADRRRLAGVLLNVLTTAIMASPPDGTVELVVTPGDELVRIGVTGSGRASSSEDPQQPVTPLDTSGIPRAAIDDSGVGQAFITHVVEAMGGTVGDDPAVGQGTAFWFALPNPDAPPRPDRVDEVEPHAAVPMPSPSTSGRANDREPADPPPILVPARNRVSQWLLDAPLRRKLLIVVASMAVVWLPPIGIGWAVSAQLANAATEATTASSRVERINRLQDSLRDSVSAMQGYLVLGFTEPDLVDAYRVASASMEEQAASLESALPADLAPRAQQVEESIGALLDGYDELIALGRAATEELGTPDDSVQFEFGTPEAEGLVTSVLNSLVLANGAYEDVTDLEDEVLDRLADTAREVDRLHDLLVWATLASMIVALVVAAGGSYLVANGVVRRIQVLSGNADRLVRDEPLLPAVAAGDEIGQLTDRMLVAGSLLNRRREQAVAATRAKDEFLSRVSLSLKNPLAAMIGFAQRLEVDPDLSPESRSDVAHIISAGHHLHQLIDELLDIKAIEAGKLAISVETVQVHEAAADAIRLVRSMPASRSISISLDCPNDVVVAADRRRLREVLLNLLSNAVKYNRSDGTVHLVARHRGDAVRIDVTDTGRGISVADQKRLFTPFERLDAGDTDIEGSGVGLSLTKHVVEAMGGDIGVDSAPGAGSTFWFRLPAASADAGVRAPGDAAVEPVSGGTGVSPVDAR